MINDADVLEEPLNYTEKKKIRKKLGVPYEKVVLSVGRLVPNKGYDVFIRSMKDLPKEIGIYIVGENHHPNM